MFHFSMEKVKSASRGIFWLGGALPAVGSLFTDFLSPLGPYSFFLALLLGVLTVLALIAAVIPPVNRVLHSWSAHWAEGVLAVLLCGFLVFSGMFALELSTDPHKGFLASESEKLAEIQKILLNIADTTARIDERTERIEAQTSRTDARTERVEGKVADIDRKMGGLKRETSSNPRKELANLGVPYNSEGYLGALNEGDEHALALFFQAGMDFYVRHPMGLPAIMSVCHKNIPSCMKAIAVASRYKIDTQKSVPLETKFWTFHGLPMLLNILLSPEITWLEKYPLTKKFVYSRETSLTTGDLIILCAKDNIEQIVQFIHEYTIPYDKSLKFRHELTDFLSASLNSRMIKSSNSYKPYLKEAEQYVHVTQQLEKALGVSR